MCVLLFDVFNGCTSLGIFGETCILALSSSAVFRLQKRVSYFFYLLCSGDKMPLPEFLRKWGWFHEHNERFPKYLSQKLKFQKTETKFCGWKSSDYNNINIFLSLENPCTFLLAKEKTWKRMFNATNELSQNHIEKQIMPIKTTVYWLFNDIWCYLIIGCFDWKIIVRVYISLVSYLFFPVTNEMIKW